MREEKDSFGEVLIPDGALWGPATQRSLTFFSIGEEKMPRGLLEAGLLQKKAAARANYALGRLDEKRTIAIEKAVDRVFQEQLWDHFPLYIWQTGSGTQTNMNLNEVLASLANMSLGGKAGDESPVHPNDHVNASQSTNDSFPTMMHMAALSLRAPLMEVLNTLIFTFHKKGLVYKDLVKIARTHVQDATPIRFAQELSGYEIQLSRCREWLEASFEALLDVPQGGTAVGTGMNAPLGFDHRFVEELAHLSGIPFRVSPNKFSQMSAHDEFVQLSGTLNTLAGCLLKIANDVRMLASGPRCGLGELSLPENEAGSSIMPGKVNPTQCEALSMVCMQVMGNHLTVTLGGSGGFFNLNMFKPLIIFNVLQSLRLLKESMANFCQFCLEGLVPCAEKMKENVDHCLMLATALDPHIGYEQATKIVQLAQEKRISLKEASVESGFMSAEQFDQWVNVHAMLSPD